ncbi:M16 family metallopeptidase [Legionella spiritensis]|uniref:Zinc protease (Peptidase, M16 family) n=1 Tax=Legionella spiritensis TaxID=452 RepID=A0A0W0Z5G7_LEGSP|nr:pitrilysin family protein [Legionella spiritensis]KTD64393.1 zinc protease (peptidase, M16 family) [Legionella spiritensis]SNV46136.1 zinc protease (peptidase, M16 family) [Legionella spiritensis]
MKKWLCLFTSLTLLIPAMSYSASFKVKRWQTDNGARVVFYEAPEVPMLDINIAFAAGSAYDGKSFGLSTLTTQLLDQGNGKLDASQIAESLADTGAQFNAQASRDMIIMRLKTLTSEPALGQAMKTFSLIVNKPDFPLAAFKREKNQQLVAIAQSEESPDDVANNIFFDKLYPNHPYGHPVNGTVESVKAITPQQVRAFYKRYFTGANTVIVLVGAINEEKARQLASQLTQFMPKGQPAPAIPKARALPSSENIHVKFPSSQTMLRLGQVGIDHAAPDYFPLLVGNYILGGGSLVSRLAHEVRERRGLTYGVVSQFMPMPGDGPFLISLSTKNSQAQKALAVTRETLSGFLKTGPSEKELVAAKQYLTGSFPLSLASNSSIAGMLLRIAFYKLPDDYLDTYIAHIESVSTADIKKAFQDQINPEQMLLVTVGNT